MEKEQAIEKTVDFILKYSTYKTKEKVKDFVEKHYEYKTCYIILDDINEVIAFCRWNVSQNMNYFEVLDCIIREDHRNRNLMADMIENGLKIWPVKFIRFKKGYDDGTKQQRWHIWNIQQLLRRLKKNVQHIQQSTSTV